MSGDGPKAIFLDVMAWLRERKILQPGVTTLARLIAKIRDDSTRQLRAAHGDAALVAALQPTVLFRRWRAGDVRSILAAAGAAPTSVTRGQALLLALPSVPVRPLTEYAFGGEDQ